MITHRILGSLFLSVICAVSAVAQLPELRDLDLTGWDCLSKLEAAAKTQDGKERNVQKNRSAIELTGIKEGYHHPWRSTAWESHPVMKIEDLGTE